MADRNLELAIKIQGQVDQSLPASVRKAMSDAANLQKSLGQLKGIEANAQKYKELQKAAQSLSTEFNQAKARASQLGAEFRNNQAVAAQYKAQIEQAKAALAGISKSANPQAYAAARANLAQLTAAYKTAKAAVKSSEADFKQAGKAAQASGTAYQNNQAALRQLANELRQAGFNTEQFASSQENLQQQLNRTNAALNQAKGVEAQYRSQQQKRLQQKAAHENAQANFFAAASNFETAKSAAFTIVSPFKDAIEDAIKFESVMADVKKVVDFDTPKQFQQMSDDILALSQRLPMTAEGIAAIVAAGGQSGIAKGELLSFAESAAKMGIAFDVTAEQAGDMMAKWRTAFKMGQNDVVGLADKINYLGNTTAASAPLISDVVTRIGPLGEIGGVASGEIAALGASMVGTGVQSDVAATGIKNLILGMVAGEGATKSQAAAFKSLGLNAVTMAQRMQKDAKGAIMDVFKAIQGLDKYQQATVLADLFGKESIGAISPLLSNLDALQDNFEKVADASKYAGSMEEEYAARSATTENKLQLLKNTVNAASKSIGNAFLPAVQSALDWLQQSSGGIMNWVRENQNVVKIAGIAAVAIAGLTIAIAGAAVAFAAWGFFSTTLVEMKAAFMGLKAVTLMSAAATWLHTAATTALGVATNALKNPITTATTLLGGMKNGLLATKTAVLGMPAMIGRAFVAIPGLISGAFAALPGIMATLATVGLPVILAIGAIIAVIAILAANWNNIKETATIVWNHISGTISAQVARIKAAFGDMVDRILAAWNSVTGGTATSADWILGIINNVGFAIGVAFDIAAGVVGTAISVIMNLIASVAQFIGGVVNIIVGIITGDWEKAWNGAGQAVDGFLGGTVGTFKTIAGGISDMFDTLMGKADEVQKKAELASKSRETLPQVTADYMPDEGMMQTAQAAQETAQATAEASANAQALSANVEQSGAAAQQTASHMDQLNQLLQQMPATGQTAFASMGEQSATAAQAVGINMQQIPTQAQTTFQQLPPMAQQGTDAMVQEFSQLATKCQPGADAFIQAANTWGQQAYENIANWAGQMAQVVVDRLSQAWSQISSQFSAGLHVNVTTSAPNVAHNAAGGIYNRGAFLTTFAEDSAEAAIPLDGSRRAIALWQQAGKMLGVLPPEISTIADVIAPPSEAQMAAAPVALEPPSAGGHVQVEINMPAITIQGNADGNTVANIEAVVARAVRDLERRIPDIMKANSHNERRTSLAT